MITSRRRAASPYSITGPVRPSLIQVGGNLDPTRHVYIERPHDKELFEHLRAGQYVNVLTCRQQGKSSAMRRAALRLRRAGLEVVDFDMAGDIGSQVTMDQWYSGVLDKICYDLDLDVDIDEWWQEQCSRTPAQRIQTAFRELILPELDAPLVVFVDEIDATLKMDFTDDFFAALRAMYNRRAREPEFAKVTFCLLGVAHPSELMSDKRITEYNIGISLELRDFELAADGQQLAILEMQLGDNGAELLAEIFEWLDGHPFLTMDLCKKAIEAECQTREQIRELIAREYRQVEVLRQTVHFQTAARIMESKAGLPGISLYERIRRGRSVSDSARGTAAVLKLAGLVKRGPEGKLVIRNRVYRSVFDSEWMSSLNPWKKYTRVRWRARAATALFLVALAFVGYGIYNIYFVKPDKEMRAALQGAVDDTSFWLGELREASNARDANTAYGRISERVNRLALADSQERTLARARSIDASLAAQLRTNLQESEEVYDDYWRELAEMALKQGGVYKETSRIDEALIMAAYAAAKIDQDVAAEYAALYREHDYQHLVTTLRSSDSAVNSAAFSPDGRILAIAYQDGSIQLWDPEFGHLLSRATVDRRAEVRRISLMYRSEQPTERIAVSLAGGVQLWQIEMQRVGSTTDVAGAVEDESRRLDAGLHRLPGFRPPESAGVVKSASLDPRGELLLTAGDQICIFARDDGFQPARKCIDVAGYFAEFSPDGEHIAIASSRGEVLVMNRTLRRRVARLAVDKQAVMVRFGAGGDTIAIAVLDGVGRIWRWREGKGAIVELRHHGQKSGFPRPLQLVTSVSTCRDEERNSYRYATSAWARGHDHEAPIYATAVWDERGRSVMVTHGPAPMYHATLSHDCRWLASTGREDGVVQVWSLRRGVEGEGAGAGDSPTGYANAQERWQHWQKQLRLTVDEDQQIVVPLVGRAEPKETESPDDSSRLGPVTSSAPTERVAITSALRGIDR